MPRSSNLRLLNAGKVEIWTPGFYGTLKSMSVTFMDSMSMFIVQTLGLQLMRRERPITKQAKSKSSSLSSSPRKP